MPVTADGLRKLAALNLSGEALATVLEVVAESLSSDDERRRKDRERKALSRGKSTDSPQNVRRMSAEIPRTEAVPRAPIRERVHDTKKEEDNISSLRSDIPKRQKSAIRLTLAFEPTPVMREAGRDAGMSEGEIDLEGHKMRDWSMSSKAGAKVDWEAAWRNWIRNRTPSPRAGPNGHQPPRDPFMKMLEDSYREKHGLPTVDEEARLL